MNSRNVCRNWFKIAPHFEGGIRLHIPQVDVTGPSEQEDEDARVRVPSIAPRIVRWVGTQLLEPRATQTQHAQATNA